MEDRDRFAKFADHKFPPGIGEEMQILMDRMHAETVRMDADDRPTNDPAGSAGESGLGPHATIIDEDDENGFKPVSVLVGGVVYVEQDGGLIAMSHATARHVAATIAQGVHPTQDSRDVAGAEAIDLVRRLAQMGWTRGNPNTELEDWQDEAIGIVSRSTETPSTAPGEASEVAKLRQALAEIAGDFYSDGASNEMHPSALRAIARAALDLHTTEGEAA